MRQNHFLLFTFSLTCVIEAELNFDSRKQYVYFSKEINENIIFLIKVYIMFKDYDNTTLFHTETSVFMFIENLNRD